MTPKVPKIEVSDDNSFLTIAWSDSHKSKCSVKWIRFHCQCKRCLRLIPVVYPLNRSLFASDLKIEKVTIKDDKLLCNVMGEVMADHVTVLPLEYLESHCNCDSCLDREIDRREMKALKPGSPPPTVEYDKVLCKEGLYQCLKYIIDHGFCLVKNFPTDKSTMMGFLESIGSLRPTFYGKDWNVVNRDKDAVNGAYTNFSLPYHQDLPMYETSPGVQILLTLKFDKEVKGGESKLVDLVRCANILRKENPKCFDVLCRVPATFETKDLKRENPAWFEHTKTHIEVDYFGKIVAIAWSPGTEGALRVREKDVDAYYEAHEAFYKIINDSENEITFTLQQGDMLIFNNHRMAHTREAFQSKISGNRNLLGCYMNLDELKSKYMVLAHQLNEKIAPPKICNRSSI